MTEPLASPYAEDDARHHDRRERTVGASRAFRAVKAQHAARRTAAQRFADRLTRIASSTTFLLVHLLWFVVWIAINSGAFGRRPFDGFPFGLLTLILSVEAIILTIFVLMSQGREAAIAELREEITLQVNLRIEEEVTKTLQLVTGLYARLGYPIGIERELRDMLRPLDAHEIEDDLVEQMSAGEKSDSKEEDDNGGRDGAGNHAAAEVPLDAASPARTSPDDGGQGRRGRPVATPVLDDPA